MILGCVSTGIRCENLSPAYLKDMRLGLENENENIYYRYPVYIVASLLEISEWGGTDSDSLKAGIDSIFNEGGKMHITDYTTKLIGLTSDGASVNTGCRNGLMVQLEREDRD